MTGTMTTRLKPALDARRRRVLALAAALLLAATACADIKPMEYTEVHEIRPGPGLISGEDGEFVLYGQ